MAPTIGRIVIFQQGAHTQPVNGTREHPALITRVHSETNVNLQVFFDAGAVTPCTSIPHESTAGEGQPCWRWPKREG